jgi:protocatechuate 3,4-dioxygenase beta subunit
MVSTFSMERSQENWALAYEFDIVLGGRAATSIEEAF